VSCPYVHQQNGSAEHKHRRIVEVGLSLLAHASMPLKFWDEAFSTAVFLINRLPSKVIDHATPHERLLHQPTDYTFLRTFGCAYWPNLRPYNDHKLAFRSKQCVFLGYSNLHKGCKCLDPSIGKVYISRDVVFDEQVFPFSHLHPNAGARLQSELAVLPNSLLNSNSSFGDSILLDRRDEIPPSSNHSPSHSSSVVDTRSNDRPNGENPTANGAADRRYFMCLSLGWHNRR
jgi:histone deacetylase 1/2